MSKTIQVRDAPEHGHRTLKSRAAREGVRLSDFLKKELARAAGRPTMRGWLELAQQAKPIRAAGKLLRKSYANCESHHDRLGVLLTR